MNKIPVFIVLLIGTVGSTYHDDVYQLSKKLLDGYNNMIRGSENLSRRTYIAFMFNIIKIAEYDEVNGKLAVVGFFFLQWEDYRMKWNPDHHNGTNNVMFETKDVWVPNIILTTSHSDFRKLGTDDVPVRYDSQGKSYWYPADVFSSSCTPNIYYYPYDTQICSIYFSSWGYGIQEVGFYSIRDDVNTYVYDEHGLWNLTDTSAFVHEDSTNQINAMVIQLTLTRMPTFYLINMILPIIVIGLLNILVFLLPAESGERVGYSITVLLAIAVFQTIASDKLPHVSRPQISLLCIKLLIDLVLSVLVTTLTIVSLYFYDMPDSRKVPVYLQAICGLILCKKCSPNKSEDKYDNEETYKVYKIVNGKQMTTSISLSDVRKAEKTDVINWTDVGRCSDIVFATFSLLAFIASNVAFVVLVIVK
ncbi:neuronal acetylcholine receptor subunit alpha-6-like [Saccostrea echinata]|uniref:neuronal acetylcholine receptor subunit alpha-6-like n=1 Tax=Saccostrea echinata TaxID=191078 RepID=UPI002A8353DF|nr:neuronal acetylcholine receptor subunit alpha-6-like [Saccostrea echinata]